MDIRTQTYLIIRRGAEFLVGKILFSPEYRWSRSPYDAWMTRERDEAREIAHETGGDLWLFNRVTGELRELCSESKR